ncbi:MAG: c-type cytochrome [Gemmataceae bacterium]|nr:c-type cytochrome [Gemmataceae bacterium]
MRALSFGCLLLIALPLAADAADGNRLSYLDGNDPYYVGRHFPKLTTPMWVGEDGVDAVVILAIDDMKDSKKYEDFLRPILNRLKKIDGRAPVSIMSCGVQPDDPQLQAWLKEGLSLETHTFDHPCPLLGKGGFDPAKGTYDKCVDLLASVPNSKPVAFRMPCCDSLNTLSPRFFAEIFNTKTAKGNFLQLDSSVFNITTANDPDLPRSLVFDEEGRERFRKYVPTDRSFVNTIEDYPYPYVIGRQCWQFPCAVPSDWEAQFLHKPNNPVTVRDWKALVDCTVIKQGVFCLVFHPHNWIKNEQVVDLIEYAATRHGKKVKFLTFNEALERINKNLLAGQPLRHPEHGGDNGVRLLDVNNDGHIDVVIGNGKAKQCRVWSPKEKKWTETEFPVQLVHEQSSNGVKTSADAGAHFGILRPDGNSSILPHPAVHAGGWHFEGGKWVEDRNLHVRLKPIRPNDPPVAGNLNRGIQLLDLDGDGICEAIVADKDFRGVFKWSAQEKAWNLLPFSVPGDFSLIPGKDSGVRFIDIDGDGHLDVLVSNEKGYGLYLFSNMKDGWRKVLEGKPGDKNALPLIAKDGQNMGAWFHSRHLWVQNENTALLPNLVDRRSFAQLLADVEPTAQSPEASLKAIQVRSGFKVEQAAAEPHVQDPIAFAWGPDGKLWVVEMADYPMGIDGKGKPGSRVKYLQDTNGDGKYTKATLFLDNLPWATGILPWRKGVLITCAPDILYAEDTKGTGKADKVEKLYSGFAQGNQQHRVNSLAWGLDGWVYCANGDSGGTVKSHKKGITVDIRGRDLRIRPDTGDIDLQAGQTQFGRNRDDWGNWFGNNNSSPLYHFALEDHYIRRNPHLAAPDPRVQVSVTPGPSVVYPISRTLPRFNDPKAANHFTSACSAIVYRDDLFGPDFVNSTFVCEPVHNLVHREIMTAKGTTFTSRRADDEQTSEFFRSTDNWSRPVFATTGPDGALWIADMYRAVIEHPEWIPKDWQMKLDLRAGHDKGRIYRVSPVGAKLRQIPRLDKLDTAGLVAALDSPNGWQRDLAQMMLYWNNDKAAVPLLEKMVKESKRPLARLHALCTLDGLNALTPAILQAPLGDDHPGVRRHAVRLSEPLLAKSHTLGTSLLKLATDSDAHVRLQVAYSLGEWDDPRAGKALGELAIKDVGDRFISAAVMSSVSAKNLDAVLLAIVSADPKGPPPPALLENLLRLANALKHNKAFVVLLTRVSTPEKEKYAAWQFGALAGLLDALDQRNTPLSKLEADGDAELKTAIKKLAALFQAARAVLADKNVAKEDQLLALRLIGRGLDRQTEDLDLLAGLLVPQVPSDIQAAGIAALGRMRSPKVPEVLVRGWKAYGPTMRAQVLDTLFRRDDWLAAALDAIERKQIVSSELDAIRRQRLLEHKDGAIRQRAAKLFADSIAPDRQKVIDAYQPVFKLQGDVMRGSQVFAKHCAACHKLGAVGHEVGPDLASVGDKSPQGLLISVLDPNRVVEAKYVNYTALTKNGQTYTGVLTSETGNSVTLLMPEGKPQVILRSDLDELLSTGKSPMPEGLEKDVKHQDMADLIAYVRSAVPLTKPKAFDGNKPEVVKAEKDGSLLLKATNGEIYGKTLVLEKKYGNLGFWTSEDDHVTWSVEVPKAGKYAVWIDYACAENPSAKAFLLEAGANQLTSKVAVTGSWDVYKQTKAGELVLSAGAQRLTLRSSGRPTFSGLMDLKSVKLVPIQD